MSAGKPTRALEDLALAALGRAHDGADSVNAADAAGAEEHDKVRVLDVKVWAQVVAQHVVQGLERHRPGDAQRDRLGKA